MPIVTLNADCYFEYQSSNDPPIGTSNTNWYFEFQLVLRIPKLLLQIPIVTLNTNCYFKYQLLLQIPIVTSKFKYQMLLPIPIVTSDAMSNDPPRRRRRISQQQHILKSRAKVGVLRDSHNRFFNTV
jgi:hypothetical protein